MDTLAYLPHLAFRTTSLSLSFVLSLPLRRTFFLFWFQLWSKSSSCLLFSLSPPSFRLREPSLYAVLPSFPRLGTGRRVLVSSLCFPLSFHPFELTSRSPAFRNFAAHCRLTQIVCFVLTPRGCYCAQASFVSVLRFRSFEYLGLCFALSLPSSLPFFLSLHLNTTLQTTFKVHSKCLKSQTLFFLKVPSFSSL